VSTSNSLFVTKANPPGYHGARRAEEASLAEAPSGSLTAMGQCSSVLELQLVRYDAAVLLGHVFPSWTPSDSHLSTNSMRPPVSQGQAFASIPCTQPDLESGWRKLFCFELTSRSPSGEISRKAYIPSPSALLSAWRSVMQSLHLRGASQLQPWDFETITADDDADADADAETEALAKVRHVIGMCSALHSTPSTNLAESRPSGFPHLDPQKTTLWLGSLLVQETSSAKSMGSPNKPYPDVSSPEFATAWTTLLPEDWVQFADAGILLGAVTEAGGMLDRFAAVTKGEGKERDGEQTPVGPSTQGTGDGKDTKSRKWHEKFREGRNSRK
jgi:hypothetical protein